MTLILARREGTHRKTVRTIDRLIEPWVMAHRGGGSANTQENALESMRTARANIPAMQVCDGGDVKFTSDSQMVCMHDDDVSQVTTGTGTVATMTLAALKALSLKNYRSAAWPGIAGVATSAKVPTFAEWLTEAKRLNVVITPEIKSPGNATLRDAMVSAIVAAGMQNQVLFQSFTLADLAAPKAAGIKTVYLDNQGANTNSNASVIAAAPDYYGYDFSDTVEINNARLTALRDGLPNLKYTPWTIERRFDLTNEVARLASLNCHYAGIASHDPWWVGQSASQPPVLTQDPYATYGPQFASGQMITYPGHLTGILKTDKHGYSQSGGVWRQSFAYVATGSSYQTFNLQGWGCKTAPWTQIEFDLTCDVLDQDATRWGGLVWNCTDDRPFDDDNAAVAPNSKGYVIVLRQNGQIQIFRRDSSVASSSSVNIGGPTSSTAWTAGAKRRIRVQNMGDGHMKITRLDTNAVVDSSIDTTYRGGYFWFGKSVTGSTGPAGGRGQWSFSNVALT